MEAKLSKEQTRELESILADLSMQIDRYKLNRSRFLLKYLEYFGKGYDCQVFWESYKQINSEIYGNK